MDAIYIPQLLQTPEKKQEFEFKEFLPGLETLTPVRGRIRIKHQVNYLEVSVTAETIATLTCDRCLQQYNHRLAIDTSEIIWLNANSQQDTDLPIEQEVAVEDLVETLSSQGHFYPHEWLYEQACLAIPQRQLCDNNCPGIVTEDINEKPIDSRWASLEALKKQFPS
ncbi:YceD family protein [Mastigocoleus testarum]|uniref:Metal-binding protein n=1 Tax=Mastigocoleus testarum BC008 TaxID=371196 RepID=A0A0V8A0J7_9CYAN|nr:YceD family protein [Mastigocoleus testarum]KST70129.1 metal-binding protein [Mastigocoleus testarum BC008]